MVCGIQMQDRNCQASLLVQFGSRIHTWQDADQIHVEAARQLLCSDDCMATTGTATLPPPGSNGCSIGAANPVQSGNGFRTAGLAKHAYTLHGPSHY